MINRGHEDYVKSPALESRQGRGTHHIKFVLKPGSPSRYTQQLSGQETRLEKLQAEKEDLDKKSEAAQAQVDKMIEELAIEAVL